IVFGEERNGLLRDELLRCHLLATIPTAPSFPSLNVAQAVGLFAYELTRRLSKAAPDNNAESQIESLVAEYPTGAEDDEFFIQLDALFQNVEFTRTYNRENIITELRTFYQRSRPTVRER